MLTNTELLAVVVRQAEKDVCFWRECAERRQKRERELLERIKVLEQRLQPANPKKRVAPDATPEAGEVEEADAILAERHKKLTKDNEYVLHDYYEKTGCGLRSEQ